MMKDLMVMDPVYINAIVGSSAVVAGAFVAYGASVGIVVFVIDGAVSSALVAGVNAVASLGSMISTLAAGIGAIGGLAIIGICAIVITSWKRKTLVREVTEEVFTLLSSHKCILDAKAEALRKF